MSVEVIFADMKQEYKKWLVDNFGSLVRFDEPMSKHTTFRIGGPATMIQINNDKQLQKIVRWARGNAQTLVVLGAGSNLLVRDTGIAGLVVKLAHGFKTIRLEVGAKDSTWVKVTAGAAAMVRDLGRYALARDLAGLSFTLGIPGTVGGALRMNAGAWGSVMADTVLAVSLLDGNGNIVTRNIEELCFRYRKLCLDKGDIILKGTFNLKRGDRQAIRRRVAQMQKRRAAVQPLAQRCAGSIFRNPSSGLSAGELIDKAGLKGRRQGDAEISTKHANFIVNKGRAKASDVIALMEIIQETVFQRFGVTLEPEVTVVG